MKIKVYTYLAVVPMLLGLIACAKQSTPSTTITDPAGITLIPYTSEDFRIIGFVPEGRVEVK